MTENAKQQSAPNSQKAENLIAAYETADGRVEIHGLRGGYTVFVGERMVQNRLNGRDITCYLAHCLQAAHYKLSKQSGPSDAPEPTKAHEDIRERVLSERDRGHIVFRGLPGSFMGAKLDDFVEQPADGILYDLNRDEATVLTFIHDPKWVNDFAVALTIRKLVQQRDEARKSATPEQAG